MSDKPNCYECKWRRDLPGNCHSQCAHPNAMEGASKTSELMALLGAPMFPVRNSLNVLGDPHGIRQGWFCWPFNFDPTWLVSCDGFEKKEQSDG